MATNRKPVTDEQIVEMAQGFFEVGGFKVNLVRFARALLAAKQPDTAEDLKAKIVDMGMEIIDLNAELADARAALAAVPLPSETPCK